MFPVWCPPKLLPRGVTWELSPQVISICSICWCVEHEDHPQNWVYYGGFTMKVIIGFSYVFFVYHIWVVFILVLNLGNSWEWAELLIAMDWIPPKRWAPGKLNSTNGLVGKISTGKPDLNGKIDGFRLRFSRENQLEMFRQSAQLNPGEKSIKSWKSRDTPTKTCLLSLTRCYQSCLDDVALSENRLPQNLMVYHHFANSNSHLVVSSKFTVRKWSTFIIILLEGDHQKFNRRT